MPKRVLLDENIPARLARLLPEFETHHVHVLGWAGKSDVELLNLADAAGFAVLSTADKSLAYQQNLRGRKIALIALSSNNWNVVKSNRGRISRLVKGTAPGTFGYLSLDPSHQRNRPPSRT